MTLLDSLNYVPDELGFGTSGLRGLLSDMTDLECYINTLGFLTFLKDTSSAFETVYIAEDLRSSTPRIMAAVAQAIEDFGVQYENCGFVATPAVAHYALQKNAPCVMVTGSHIPDDRNGIKFYKTDGEVLKADEAAIKKSVATVRDELYNSDDKRFNTDRSFKTPHELSVIVDAAEYHYGARYVRYFSETALSGQKIVMYQHSSVARDHIPHILEEMGAEVVCVERSEAFVPIDTENVKPTDEALFKRLAAENPGCNAIISTDGDGDRPFVIDETGRFHRGDVLGVVVAQYLGSKAAAVPVSSNDAALEVFKNEGIEYRLTKIGSPHVIVAMQELADEFENVSGWEVNGGFLTGEPYQNEKGAILDALPTRDALLPIICALLAAKQQNLKVSELFAQLPKRYTQAGLIDNFPNAVSGRIIETLSRKDDAAKELITQVFTEEQGFGEVADIITTDGVRIVFDNNITAHLRPSGNAPQLRIYSNADSQERADEIVAQGVAEPEGLLRQFEKLV